MERALREEKALERASQVGWASQRALRVEWVSRRVSRVEWALEKACVRDLNQSKGWECLSRTRLVSQKVSGWAMAFQKRARHRGKE